MSDADVFWLASIYLPVGILVVWVLRKYVPRRPPDDDIDIRFVVDGLLVLIWPLIAVFFVVVGLLTALGWLASRGSEVDR